MLRRRRDEPLGGPLTCAPSGGGAASHSAAHSLAHPAQLRRAEPHEAVPRPPSGEAARRAARRPAHSCAPSGGGATSRSVPRRPALAHRACRMLWMSRPVLLWYRRSCRRPRPRACRQHPGPLALPARSRRRRQAQPSIEQGGGKVVPGESVPARPAVASARISPRPAGPGELARPASATIRNIVHRRPWGLRPEG